MSQYDIAVVDDEPSIRRNVSYALSKAGFRLRLYEDGASALEECLRSMPDLIILDIMMPRMDGLELCRRLRSQGERVPVIFLSSRDEELDRLLGFESGGDDYLCKPFSLRELVARVQAVLRRSAGTSGALKEKQELQLASLSIDLASARLCRGGESCPLTLTELRILQALLDPVGRIRSRRELMVAAFPEDSYPNERAADSHIKRVRRKIAALGEERELIETVYGMGYRVSNGGEEHPGS